MTAIVAAALIMRSLISAVPPAIGAISSGLGLSSATAALTTTLPLICFSIFGLLAPSLTHRWGAVPTMSAGLLLAAAGSAVRCLPTTAALLAGTTLIGIGIALANVLVPVVIRRFRPHSVAASMGWYSASMGIGAAVASLVTGPLLSRGFTWKVALAVWIPVAVAACLVWLWAAPRQCHMADPNDQRADIDPVPRVEHSGWHEVLSAPRTHVVALFMGLQSLVFYTELTWLPDQITAHGLPVWAGSVGLALFNGIGIVAATIYPRLVSGRHGVAVLVLGSLAYAAGLALTLTGAPGLWLAPCLLGFMQGGTFATALLLIANTGDPSHLPETSAYAQGIGYLIAAIGPVALGALHDAQGSWSGVVLVLVLAVAVVGTVGVGLVRHEQRP